MSKLKLNKVELKNVKNVGVLVVEKKGIAGTKNDKRTNNPGRPVNKKSARYKRLQKQAFYASVNSKFVKGNQFKLSNTDTETYTYKPSDNGVGCILRTVTGYVCNVSYIGRTKVQAFTFVLGKQVKVELNLKTIKFVS